MEPFLRRCTRVCRTPSSSVPLLTHSYSTLYNLSPHTYTQTSRFFSSKSSKKSQKRTNNSRPPRFSSPVKYSSQNHPKGSWLASFENALKYNQLNEALTLGRALTENDSIKLWNTCLEGMGSRGRAKQMGSIFARLLALDIRPNRDTYRSLVEGYATTGDISKMRTVYNDSLKIPAVAKNHHLDTFEALFHAYINAKHQTGLSFSPSYSPLLAHTYALSKQIYHSYMVSE